MEIVLLVLPGYFYYQLAYQTRDREKTPTLEQYVQFHALDGWRLVFQSSALSFVLLIMSSLMVKLAGFVLGHFFDLGGVRTFIHNLFERPFVVTYLFSIALAVAPFLHLIWPVKCVVKFAENPNEAPQSRLKLIAVWWARKLAFLYRWKRLGDFLNRFERHIGRQPREMPYDKIVYELAFQRKQAFFKFKSGTYMIGLIGMAASNRIDNQITVMPKFTGRRRELLADEITFFNSDPGNAKLISEGKMKAADEKKTYLVFDTSYELFDQNQASLPLKTEYLVKMDDIEYISEFHQDVHDQFVEEGKTIPLV